MRWWTALLAGALGLSAAGAGAAGTKAPPAKAGERPPALKGHDPVELANGKEVKGRPGVSLMHGAYRYVFASEANRKRFEKEPGRYAVQFGGACMRMGPLSSPGHPDRYHVHGGRIYLFASKSCRNSFKARPERFLDGPDDPPEGTAAAAKKAAALLGKAVEALGGAKRLRELKTVEVRSKLTYAVKGGEVTYPQVAVLALPGQYAQETDFGRSKSGWKLLKDGGHVSGAAGPVEGSVREHMQRLVYRQPVALLRAWADGRAKAFAAGPGKVGETAVERVAVGVGGATATLSIDPATGRLLRMAYRGRAGAGVGVIERTYSDFRQVGGLTLPFAAAATFDGKPLEGPRVVTESIRVNEKAPAGLLERPAGK